MSNKQVIRLNESQLKHIVKESVKIMINEGNIHQRNKENSDHPKTEKFTEDIDKVDLKKIENWIIDEEPGLLYGGGILKGKITFIITEVSNDCVKVRGRLYLYVDGDFDDDNMQPKWITYNIDSTVTYYRISDYDEGEHGGSYDVWEREDFVYNYNLGYKILELLFDTERLIGKQYNNEINENRTISNKQAIRLNESQLRQVVSETVKRLLSEDVKKNVTRIRITGLADMGRNKELIMDKLLMLRHARNVGDEENVNNTVLGALRRYGNYIQFEII